MARQSKDIYYIKGGELYFKRIYHKDYAHRPMTEELKKFINKKRNAIIHGSKRVCFFMYYREFVAINSWLLNHTEELIIPEYQKGDTIECYGNIPIKYIKNNGNKTEQDA